ncbi:probable serine threonine- kinase gdt4 [Paramuricea clavata]|uniref:Probable serine threonine- kinase gdt4 n=1 Tax=Paramuricea clavata TaxID=317549 RepID=A0A6S7FHV3_PARCT|nr:probable serine threonine- kinase gdt4 [Paramuricea clavata]
MEWAVVLQKCAAALAHIHDKGYIHGDIKHNNIILQNSTGFYEPVIIDFGKMKKAENAKIYKLNTKERDHYLKCYKHIAPEIVWGKSAASPASDIYSFGQVISLVVYYTKLTGLQKIAKACKMERLKDGLQLLMWPWNLLNFINNEHCHCTHAPPWSTDPYLSNN